MSQGSPVYNATVFGTGSTAALTDEACTEVSGTVFQITDTAKRILDHDVAVVVKVDAAIQSSGYSVNHNTGKVTFTTSQTGSTVTVTASYLPRIALAKLLVLGFEMLWESEETATIGEEGEAHTFTIQRVAIDIEALQLLNVDLYGTTSLIDVFRAKTVLVMEINPAGASGESYHARGMFPGASFTQGGPASVVKSTLKFIGGSRGTTLLSVS